jgi:type I restriction enzyme, S subunit
VVVVVFTSQQIGTKMSLTESTTGPTQKLSKSDFPSCDIDLERVFPNYLGWLVRSASFVSLCQMASEGTTNRVRIKEDRFLSQQIALPPIDVQRAITKRLEAASERVRQVIVRLNAIEADSEHLLAMRFVEALLLLTGCR